MAGERNPAGQMILGEETTAGAAPPQISHSQYPQRSKQDKVLSPPLADPVPVRLQLGRGGENVLSKHGPLLT